MLSNFQNKDVCNINDVKDNISDSTFVNMIGKMLLCLNQSYAHMLNLKTHMLQKTMSIPVFQDFNAHYYPSSVQEFYLWKLKKADLTLSLPN